VLEGTGFAPRSSEQSDEYYIEGEDLALIATAEMSITGYHMDEIIDEDKLPLFYAGRNGGACFGRRNESPRVASSNPFNGRVPQRRRGRGHQHGFRFVDAVQH